MSSSVGPRRRTQIQCLVVAIALLFASCVSAEARRSEGHPAGADLPDSDMPIFLGRTAPGSIVEFSLALRLPGEARLQRFLEAAHDPASDGYGQSLDAGAFGRRFGLPQDQIDRVVRILEKHGLTVAAMYPQRTAITMRGEAAEVNRLFDLTLGDFVDGSGARFRAPIDPARIPAQLKGSVIEIAGLNNRPLLHPAGVLGDILHPKTGLTPDDVARAYDVTPLHDMGFQGQGQTIAIVSFATFDDSDIAGFDQAFGIDGPSVEHVLVNGGAGPTGDDDNCVPGPEICHSVEVNLDIDVIRGLVPRAQILNYEAPNTSGFADVVNQIVADGRADIVSISWGSCDVGSRSQAEEQAFQAAEAAGISVFVATGDTGAYDCQSSRSADHRVTVDYPGDSPHVVGVGGTRLAVRMDGTYLEEAGWEDVLYGSGTGGGLNPVDPLPSWQVGLGVQNGSSNGNRQVPDVAAAADPDSGSSVFFRGKLVAFGIGGTSAAAPFWAGSMLLIRQFVQRQGVDRLGFVNPMLYQIAADPKPFPAFHDVVRGGNRLYNCAPGWDFATGLGSPDVYNLARDAGEYLRQKNIG